MPRRSTLPRRPPRSWCCPSRTGTFRRWPAPSRTPDRIGRACGSPVLPSCSIRSRSTFTSGRSPRAPASSWSGSSAGWTTGVTGSRNSRPRPGAMASTSRPCRAANSSIRASTSCPRCPSMTCAGCGAISARAARRTSARRSASWRPGSVATWFGASRKPCRPRRSMRPAAAPVGDKDLRCPERRTPLSPSTARPCWPAISRRWKPWPMRCRSAAPA